MFGSKKSSNININNNTNSDPDCSFHFDPFQNINNNNIIDEDKHFSILNLKNDVNEYMNYRSKYYFYNNKLKKHFIIRRRTYKKGKTIL